MFGVITLLSQHQNLRVRLRHGEGSVAFGSSSDNSELLSDVLHSFSSLSSSFTNDVSSLKAYSRSSQGPGRRETGRVEDERESVRDVSRLTRVPPASKVTIKSGSSTAPIAMASVVWNV